jgi:hypothetical protein
MTTSRLARSGASIVLTLVLTVTLSSVAQAAPPNVGARSAAPAADASGPAVTVAPAVQLATATSTLDHLVISPAHAVISDGMSQTYSAEGFDAADASLGDVTASTTFFVDGVACAGAVCTGSTGDHSVTATIGSVTGSPATLHVDVNDTYHPIPPTRFLDTRNGIGLSGKFVGGVPRCFLVATRLGIPAQAVAATVNVTIVQPTAFGSMYLGPDPAPYPVVPTITFNKNDITAYGSTIDMSSGSICATYMVTTGTTDLVADVTGYFTADTSGDTYHPVKPVRLLDTRAGNGLKKAKIVANTPVTFTVAGRGGIPKEAKAVTGNLTVVNETSNWAVYIGPAKVAKPQSSTLNFFKGQVRANSLTVILSSTGTLSATYMAARGNTTDLVFDVTGYYTADLSGSRWVPVEPAPKVALDTRYPVGLSGRFVAGTPRTFQVTDGTLIPTYATGVTGVVSVRNQTANWAIFVGPDPIAKPSTSSLNFVQTDYCSNGVTVALSKTGTLSITYLGPSGAKTDVIFLVGGYFAP